MFSLIKAPYCNTNPPVTIYALLSNFGISWFTRFFAPDRPGPPHGFSSSPHPAPPISSSPRPAGKGSAPHIPDGKHWNQKVGVAKGKRFWTSAGKKKKYKGGEEKQQQPMESVLPDELKIPVRQCQKFDDQTRQASKLMWSEFVSINHMKYDILNAPNPK